MPELRGKLLRLIWRGEAGRLIARVQTDAGDEATVIGPGPEGGGLETDLVYQFHGEWGTHERHGREFRFDLAVLASPTDRRGVVAYLVRTADNVGERRASRLYDLFGADAVRRLREEPGAVADAGVMPLAEALEASADLEAYREFEEARVGLFSLLANRGFWMNALVPFVLRLWGRNAPQFIRRDPHVLLVADAPSAGWERCDRLYLDLGNDPLRLKRQLLAAEHALRELRGDTWVKAEWLASQITRLIGERARPKDAMRLGKRTGRLAVRHQGGQAWLALGRRAQNEQAVADKVKELLSWTRTKEGCDPKSLRARLLATPTATGRLE